MRLRVGRHLSTMHRCILLFWVTVVFSAVVFTYLFLLVLHLTSPHHPTSPSFTGYLSLSDRRSSHLVTITGHVLQTIFHSLKPTNCSYLTPPKSKHEIRYQNKYWQNPYNSSVYLYSAFYDSRVLLNDENYHWVRIVSMIEGAANETLYCQLWYSNKEHISVKAHTLEIWVQYWDRNPKKMLYRPFLISCPIPLERNSKRPQHVSVGISPCGKPTTLLPIKKDGNAGTSSSNEPKDYKFLLCVKGMNYESDISKRLVEWIEFNRLLGADKFFMYNYAVHPNTEKVLKYYQNLGIVKLVQLTLPGTQPNRPDLRTKFLRSNIWQKRRNELVPYNDCLYRNMYDYRFIVPIDLDEVIVPVKGRRWTDVLKNIQEKEADALEKFVALSVQNAYFLEEFYNSKDTNESSEATDLHVLKYTRRSSNFSRPGYSVKSFVQGWRTLTIFNHYPLEAVQPSQRRPLSIVLPTSDVQMNHYKERCPRSMYSQCRDNFRKYHQEDNIVLKYSKQLTKAVTKVLSKLQLT